MKSQTTKECWRNKVFLDLIVISVASIFVFALASIFHPFERLVSWSLGIGGSFHEGFTVLIFLAFALTIFSLRRWKELKDETAEHEKAEKALKESEEKFRSLAEQSPNMIFINSRGRVVYANKKCEEAMGVHKGRVLLPGL